jgi:hypothetical protein
MEYREQHRTYREIGKLMGCRPSVAHALVVAGMTDLIPIERKETVRLLEMSRLERLMAIYFPAAEKGDVVSTGVYLKLSSEYSKLTGLYPAETGGHGPMINNILNVDAHSEGGAANEPLQVKFVKPNYTTKPDGSVWKDGVCYQGPASEPPKQIEHNPVPLPDYWPPPPDPAKQVARDNVVPIASRTLEKVAPREDIWKRGDGPLGWMK